MPENKRQHYVPQMYQRNFAVNDTKTMIGIYNIENDQYIAAGPIKTQAYEDYFYGKDGKLEQYIANVESNACGIIEEILLNNNLPDRNSEKFAYLIKYIATLSSRTMHEVEALEEMTLNTINHLAKNAEEKKVLLYEWEMGKKMNGFSGRGAMSLYMGVQGEILLGDLEIKLLVSESNSFITSDNPVILYNMFMENKKTIGSAVGFGVLGLQIFLPISPYKCLLLYDGFIYKVGSKNKNFVKINYMDVDNINKLVCINANENIYINENATESYVRTLVYSIKGKRTQEKTEVAIHKIDKERRENLLRLSRIDIKNRLTMSYGFISELSGLVDIKENVSYIRSKNLLNVMRKIYDTPDERTNHMEICDIEEILEQIKKKYKLEEKI